MHRALHDIFAKTVGGVDEHDVAKSGLGIEREDDATAREVGAHHLLYADAEGDLEMVEALVDSVAYGAVGEERHEAAQAGVDKFEGGPAR